MHTDSAPTPTPHTHVCTMPTPLAWLARCVSVGALAGMVLSYPLWMPARTVPMVPITDFVGNGSVSVLLPSVVDASLVVLFAGLALAWIVRPASRILPGLACGIGLLLLAQDVLRTQPWFYQYLLMFCLFACRGTGSHAYSAAAISLRLLIGAVYVYSGLHKANHEFVHTVFPELISPVSAALHISPSVVHSSAYGAVAIEVAIGLAVALAPAGRWRRLAALGATGMHLFILLCLGPLGRNENAVVWPWNLIMIVAVWLIAAAPSIGTGTGPARPRLAQAPALVLACVLPTLGLFGAWPLYMSWALYGGGEPQLAIGTSDAARAGAPASFAAVSRPIDAPPITGASLMMDWISRETNARPFPEPAYLRALARRTLREFGSLDEVLIVEYARADRWTGAREQMAIPAREFVASGP